MPTPDFMTSVQTGYVLVERSSGHEVVLGDQPEFLGQLSDVCKDAGIGKVMIRGSGTRIRLSALDILDLGKQIAKVGLKIAVVESHNASAESVDFLESATLNRGGAIRFFEHEGDARQWLGVAG